MDFVQDQLFDGRKFRCLTVVDNFSRYCHAICVGKSIKGIDVVEVMEALKKENGLVPKRIQVDNGSEFISKEFDKWAYENGVTLDYSRPGKPTDNPFIDTERLSRCIGHPLEGAEGFEVIFFVWLV
jgi:putative transposase